MRDAATTLDARSAYERRAWDDAYAQLTRLDAAAPLDVDDIERLGVAAYMTGADMDAVDAMERAHHARLDEGGPGVASAARWGIWIGIVHFLAGRHAEGGGWMARAGRLLDEAGIDSAERGFLLVPGGLAALDEGDHAAAEAVFADVARIAHRFSDADLTVLGLLGQGQALVGRGDMTRGVAALDEAMVAATTGDIMPLIVGIAYCAVIIACRDAFDLGRAQEWTAALSRWCAAQPGLHPYRGQCMVHRSEIMQLRGEWSDALVEVRDACAHLDRQPGDPVMGMARYQEGQLLRLCGELDAAEAAYRDASDHGHQPQPGLALLRLAQGRGGDASAAIDRVLEETAGSGMQDATVRRAPVLAAAVEIALAHGDVEAAAVAAAELEEVAAGFESPYLRAQAGSAVGAVLLAQGDPALACARLRQAWRHWQRLDAPYEAARVRVQLARACRGLRDHDSAEMELEAARATFEQLGAAPDVAVVDALSATLDDAAPVAPAGLTAREVEVLRQVATGASNRDVANALVISERTVERHLSNVFVKLDLPSRSAATAWAYEHGLR